MTETSPPPHTPAAPAPLTPTPVNPPKRSYGLYIICIALLAASGFGTA